MTIAEKKTFSSKEESTFAYQLHLEKEKCPRFAIFHIDMKHTKKKSHTC